MVGKGAHGRQGRALLAAALRGGRDEEADVLAVIPARLPLLARLVPKGLPLGREVAVARRDPEQEGVVGRELVRGDEGDRGRLARRVHLGQDFRGEGLFDSAEMERGGLALVLCATNGELIKCHLTPSRCARGRNGDLLENVGFASGRFNAGFLRLGNLRNVAVHGILYQLGQ